MNRMNNAIWMGVMLGSLAVIYLGMVIANPQLPQQVQSVEATVESQVKNNFVQAAPAPSQPVADGLSNCSINATFPNAVRQWCRSIEDNATQQQLDPNLVAAVMMQESGGNPSAYSGSGAVGLLQIMPSDGVAAAFNCGSGPCFASRPRTQELLNPQFNIAYGTKMLAGLLQHYGNMREALRAYGPMDVGYGYADTVLAIYSRN